VRGAWPASRTLARCAVSGDDLPVSTRPSSDRGPRDARRRWSARTVALVAVRAHSDEHCAEGDEKSRDREKTQTGAARGSI
jgi:hypothetical protein